MGGCALHIAPLKRALGTPFPRQGGRPVHEPLCPEKTISGFSPETCHQKSVLKPMSF